MTTFTSTRAASNGSVLSKPQHRQRRIYEETSSSTNQREVSHPFSIDSSDDEEESGMIIRRRQIFSKAQSIVEAFSDSSSSSEEEEEKYQRIRRTTKKVKNIIDVPVPSRDDSSQEDVPQLQEEGSSSSSEEDEDDIASSTVLSSRSSFPQRMVFQEKFISAMAPIQCNHGELIKCVVIRVKSLVHSTYKLVHQRSNTVILQARKQVPSVTSNYHIFDMTMPRMNDTLSKKNGNYVGKLRSLNTSKTRNVFLSKDRLRSEVGALEYLDAVDDALPRQLVATFPPLMKNNTSMLVPSRKGKSSLLLRHERDLESLFILQSRKPSFDNGCYRLNFNGRVSVPSVKNFQMNTTENEVGIQFGKVSEDRFHLDYKAPITPFQAFCLALCQFNL